MQGRRGNRGGCHNGVNNFETIKPCRYGMKYVPCTVDYHNEKHFYLRYGLIVVVRPILRQKK